MGLTQFRTRYNLFGSGHRGEWGLDKLHSVHWDQTGSSFIFEYYHGNVQKLQRAQRTVRPETCPRWNNFKTELKKVESIKNMTEPVRESLQVNLHNRHHSAPSFELHFWNLRMDLIFLFLWIHFLRWDYYFLIIFLNLMKSICNIIYTKKVIIHSINIVTNTIQCDIRFVSKASACAGIFIHHLERN